MTGILWETGPSLVTSTAEETGSGRFTSLTSYKIEASWGQQTTGNFTFGSSTLGGPDVLAASGWAFSFLGPHDDLTSYGRSIAISGGRDTDLGAVRSRSLTLKCRDATGLFNRLNGGSPLSNQLIADTPIRITGYDSVGIAYPLYYGFLQTIAADPTQRGWATFTAVDLLTRLAIERPVITPIVGPTTGSVIAAILDWLRWTEAAMRSIDVGDSFPLSYTLADGSTDALTLISDLLNSERGIFWQTAAGVAKYVSRRSRYSQPSLGVLDRVVHEFPVGTDGTQIANQWTIARTDMAGNPTGTPQVAQDANSIRLHGTIEGGPITTPFLASDSQALNLAQYLLLRTASGTVPVFEVPLERSDYATTVQILGRDFGDRITATVTPDPDYMPSFTSDFYIESVDHEIDTTPGNSRHRATWRLSQIPSVLPFRLGFSTLGGPDVLPY